MSYSDNIRTHEAIDALLFDLAKVGANTGTDSTEEELWHADNDRKVIIKQIRDLDEDFYWSTWGQFLTDKTEEE